MGPLGLGHPGLAPDRVARAAVVRDVGAAVTSGEWEQVRSRRNVGCFGEDREAGESPLELVEWVRDRLRLERDSAERADRPAAARPVTDPAARGRSAGRAAGCGASPGPLGGARVVRGED